MSWIGQYLLAVPSIVVLGVVLQGVKHASIGRATRLAVSCSATEPKKILMMGERAATVVDNPC